MAILELPVRNDLPDFRFKIDLEGTVYTMNFRFNERFVCWIMDIQDEQRNDILLGIPVQTDVDIASRFIKPELPPGQFLLIDQSGEQRNPDRDDFGGEIKLLYIESTEFA